MPKHRMFERKCWQRWRLKVRLHAAHKALRREARNRKRARVMEVLEVAEQAARQGHSRQLYQYIRLLAPKGYARKIRFRSSEGSMMSRAEECECMVQYVKQLFKGEAFDVPALEPLPAQYFTTSEWLWAIRQLKSHKAVPAFAASIEGWKQQALQVAPKLAEISASALSCRSPQLPSEWGQVQLAWLTKPNKAPTTPGNLRTIGLLTPDSKAFLILVKKQANPFVQHHLYEHPQYAYRTGTSTRDALLRGSQHCQRVRQALAAESSDHTSRVLQQARSELIGGLMCSLDLAKAFDSVGYQEMYLALRETQMPEPLARLILAIHADTTLHIKHCGSSGISSMSRGLRQGCPVAPMIYAAWTARFSRLLNDQLHQLWTAKHLSIFADDKHAFWQITDVASLRRAIAQLRVIIDTLRGCGMEVNIAKSSVVLALKGRQAEKIQKRVTCHWRGQHCLVIPGDTNTEYLPIVDTLPYLGAVLSYASFESQTAQARIQKAQQNFDTLRSVLRTRSSFSQRQRQRIYNACVVPAMMYGISAVGVTSQVIKKLRSAQAQHMRKLYRVYEHGVTNQSVLERAGLDPVQLLLQQARKQAANISCDQGRAPLLKQVEASRADVILADIQVVVESDALVSSCLVPVCPSQVAPIACPVCGVSFDGVASLHMHIKAQHSELNQISRVEFSRADHALFGLPFCRFCRMPWRSTSRMECAYA